MTQTRGRAHLRPSRLAGHLQHSSTQARVPQAPQHNACRDCRLQVWKETCTLLNHSQRCNGAATRQV